MDETVYHVVPHTDGWAVKKRGSDRNVRLARLKAEAVEMAKGFAQTQAPGRVIVHRLNGTIGEQLRYEVEPDGEAGEESGRWLSWRPSAAAGWSTVGAVLLGAAAAGYWWSKQMDRK